MKTPLSAVEPPLWAGLISSYYDADILDAEASDLTLAQTEEAIRNSKQREVLIVVMGNNPSVSSTPKMLIAEALADRIKDLNVSLTGIHPIAVGSRYPVVRKPFQGFPMMPWDKLPMSLYRAHNWHCLDGSPRSPYASIYTSLGCPFSCIAENEQVSMSDGTSKLISQIRAGEEVLALDEKGEVVSNLVLTAIQTAKSRDIITIKTTDNQLSCTPDHKILTPNGWIEAGSLKVGDYVVERDTEISDCRRTQQDCSISKHRSAGTQTLKNVVKQSNETPGCASKSKQVNESPFRTIKSTDEATLGEWTNSASYNVSRRTQESKRTDGHQQPYEEQADGTKGSNDKAMAPFCQSKTYNCEVDKAGAWCEWHRVQIRDNTISDGFLLCGGRQILDRSMSEREMPESRLYLEERAQQNRDSLQLNLLAQSTNLRRPRSDDRLSEYGMAYVCHYRADAKECERVDLPDSGMVHWSKITSIEQSGFTAVYDLETYPNHNFIASGIVVHNCYYCNIHALYGDKQVRFRPVDDVLKEVEILVTRYQVRNIKIWDELFAMKEDRVLAICEGLKDYDLNVWAYARLDTVTDRMLRAMKRGGINWLAYGFENVTDPKFIARTEDVIKMTRDAGINIIANFMFGLPGVTPEDDIASVEFAKKHLFEFVNFYDAKPYPGSQWYEDVLTYEANAAQYGLRKSWDIFGQFYKPSEFRQQAFRAYFTNPDYIDMIRKRWGEQAVAQIETMLEDKINA